MRRIALIAAAATVCAVPVAPARAADVTVSSGADGVLEVTGLTAAAIGDTAAHAGIPLHELTPRSGSLEDAYLALTEGAVEYQTKEVAR